MPSVRGGISGLQNWEAVRQKQATTGLEMSMIQVDEDPISRGTFLQEGNTLLLKAELRDVLLV